MRVDYFLKISRLVKRRSLAKEMCDKHLVQVNDQPAKAGKELEAGDTLRLTFRHRTLTVQVEQIPERAVSKKDAPTLYTVLEDVRKPQDPLLD
ncbi:RNA-binding S4 domain-containing protein [candidate division KSB3 bacterium]|jgi:ribosomal 50S subunit-recycling heat shock protein|uniref:RQC P-site tRNA stabilizing factor n=1 Tax=candidate division KSB3 bacterium TaxID=2044937 RepID=A0A9D5JTP1_9BACT|nr:RNA-binding S4 domain-containing protein [candidate division KSB3 bacterium]MBD3324054.1 RNA-binding S4 domain-containing protein [candidate division KSB3 bacterium]